MLETISIIGALSALFISTLVLFFNAGKMAARVDALEVWRGTMRSDMHEISDRMEELNVSIKNLTTLVDERTERRPGRIQ